MKKLFVLILSLSSMISYSQVTSSSVSSLGLTVDGACDGMVNYTVFGLTMITTTTGGETYHIALVDGENQVLDILSFETSINQLVNFAVMADPLCSPFRVIATNEGTGVVIGEIFDGQEIDPYTFDPIQLDADCPDNCLPIPTISQWGLIILSLIMIVLGLIFLINLSYKPSLSTE